MHNDFSSDKMHEKYIECVNDNIPKEIATALEEANAHIALLGLEGSWHRRILETYYTDEKRRKLLTNKRLVTKVNTFAFCDNLKDVYTRLFTDALKVIKEFAELSNDLKEIYQKYTAQERNGTHEDLLSLGRDLKNSEYTMVFVYTSFHNFTFLEFKKEDLETIHSNLHGISIKTDKIDKNDAAIEFARFIVASDHGLYAPLLIDNSSFISLFNKSKWYDKGLNRKQISNLLEVAWDVKSWPESDKLPKRKDGSTFDDMTYLELYTKRCMEWTGGNIELIDYYLEYLHSNSGKLNNKTLNSIFENSQHHIAKLIGRWVEKIDKFSETCLSRFKVIWRIGANDYLADDNFLVECNLVTKDSNEDLTLSSNALKNYMKNKYGDSIDS